MSAYDMDCEPLVKAENDENDRSPVRYPPTWRSSVPDHQGLQPSFSPINRSAPSNEVLRSAIDGARPRSLSMCDEAGMHVSRPAVEHRPCRHAPASPQKARRQARACGENDSPNDAPRAAVAEAPRLQHCDPDSLPFLHFDASPPALGTADWLPSPTGICDVDLFRASPTLRDCESLVADSHEGPDVLAIRSQSSNSSIPPTAAVLSEPDCAESAWVIDKELQDIIVQALLDEQQTPIDADYLQYHGREVQQDGDCITPSMRYMTVTWMSEALDDLRVGQNVCCMAITLLDRYLSAARAFPRSMLQLAASTCMFVATKIEGMLPHPAASAFVTLAAGAFELDDIVLFERILCQTLGFNLCAPTVHNFLTLFESTLGEPEAPLVEFLREHTHHMACYLLELSLCSFEMLRTPRHVLAVSALVLAYSDRGLLSHVAKSGEVRLEAVERYALGCVESFREHFGPQITVNAIAQSCGEMLRLLRVSGSTEAEPFVVQKFRLPKYCSVARLSSGMSTEEFRQAVVAYVGQGGA